jgi:hypothetical protein
MTVAGRVTRLPPANTPGFDVAPFSSVTIVPYTGTVNLTGALVLTRMFSDI